MKQNIINFLRVAFPFLLTIGLWRLSHPFWNPGGVLAIIPIFFCSFVRPVHWFTPFSMLMCVIIDYNFETVCFWLALYCFFCAVMGFQNTIDIARMDKDAVFAFMVFIGTAIVIQVIVNPTFTNLWRGVWMFAWLTTLYVPTTEIIKRVHHD